MPFARGGRPGLLGTVAQTTGISGTAQVRANTNKRRAAGPNQEPTIRDAPAPHAPARRPTPADPPAPKDGGQLADQLSRLADLRNAGLLTDDEFTAAKSRLLM
ncbi:hypothetical protein J2X01_002061 [Arthrobacter ginsengisoli]|uniref:SHOCT domain-containing protein n=1 Tax=Arthrobacter ginsengisoli TaxID=1356565 RepID=A0ABU1UC72_9MICC|nr:SHOCT domain-containing protein [Arthrobacter ginsengisoli]MDR7082771.1 hypothetical protein [Arthrobacter ginsengisoli]